MPGSFRYALGAFKADQPRPDDQDALVLRQGLVQIPRIVKTHKGKLVLYRIKPFKRRHKGRGTRRYKQFVVNDAGAVRSRRQAVIGRINHLLCLGINGCYGNIVQQCAVVVSIETVAPVLDLFFGNFAKQIVRDKRARIGMMRLVGNNDDLALLVDLPDSLNSANARSRIANNNVFHNNLSPFPQKQ